MFLEVYAVKLSDYSADTEKAKTPQNRRLIEMTGVRIRSSNKFEDRAEIILSTGEILLAAGSYDDLVDRIIAASETNCVARV